MCPYEAEGYLSPFFSPLIVPGLLPSWFSPAILILWIPLGFRATCYYYRKAYYRAFFFDPPGVRGGRARDPPRYAMETRFPFILQNLHRFFLYLAFIPLTFLCARRAGLACATRTSGASAWARSCWRRTWCCSPATRFGCHSLRHLVGGKLDCFSCSPRTRMRYTLLEAGHAT